MKERTASPAYADIAALKFATVIPFGKILTSRSRLSKDPLTQKGVEAARAVLQQSGLAVLDSHKTSLDIMAVGATLAQELRLSTFAGPVAGYMYYNRFLHHFFVEAGDKDSLQMFPVFRKEERTELAKSWKFHPSLASANPKEANAAFRTYAETLVDRPGDALLVAPYGSRKTFGTEVRSGIVNLLQTECPALCTLAIFHPELLKFVVYTAPSVLRFSQGSSSEDISAQVYDQMWELTERSRMGV